MERYINFAIKMRGGALFGNLVYLSLAIIRLCNIQNDSFLDAIVMCSGFLIIVIMLDTYLFCAKYNFNITKYNDDKIVNRFVFKRREIYYFEIKQIVYVGDCLVLLKECRSYDNIIKKGNILSKYFKNEFMFLLGDDKVLLKNLAKKTKCVLYIIGHDDRKKIFFSEFFEVKEI